MMTTEQNNVSTSSNGRVIAAPHSLHVVHDRRVVLHSLPLRRDDPTSVRSARRYAEKCAPAHPRPEDVTLVTSELATNAIRHGTGEEYVLAVVVEYGGVWVMVANRTTGRVPRVLRPRDDSPGRRGLYVVNEIAALSIQRSGLTVRVWAYLPEVGPWGSGDARA